MKKWLIVLGSVAMIMLGLGVFGKDMFADDITKISNRCSESQYNEVLPFKGVQFGMSIESVKSVLKDQIESVLEVNEHPTISENMSVKLSDSPFEKVGFYFRYHQLVEIRLFYTREWQLANGGNQDVYIKVARKFARMFGVPNKERDSLRWSDRDGLDLNLTSRGIEIYYRLFCSDLGHLFLTRYNRESLERSTKEFDYK